MQIVLSPRLALVDLGAGFGSNILTAAMNKTWRGITWSDAADIKQGSSFLIARLAFDVSYIMLKNSMPSASTEFIGMIATWYMYQRYIQKQTHPGALSLRFLNAYILLLAIAKVLDFWPSD